MSEFKTVQILQNRQVTKEMKTKADAGKERQWTYVVSGGHRQEQKQENRPL